MSRRSDAVRDEHPACRVGQQPGTANQAARVDHVHRARFRFGHPDVRANNQAGASEKFAREDHIHKIVWLEYTGA